MPQRVYQHPGFAKVSAAYYDEAMRLNPVLATFMGEHAYDGLLPEVGVEAVEKQIQFCRASKAAFAGLPERELSLDERIDRAGIIHVLEMELFWQEDLKRWQHGQDLADLIGSSLFLLYARDYAPLYQRVESMILRLKSVPILLETGKSLYQRVPQLWAEIYIESARQLPGLFGVIGQGIKDQVPDFLATQFHQAANEAEQAIKHWRHWFEHAVAPKADADWALGTSAFQALLGLRRLGMGSSELRDLGQMYLGSVGERVTQLARKLSPSGTRAEVDHRMKQKHPRNFDEVLDTYRDAVARCRAFVGQHEFASLPANESLEIIETPSYLSHLIPFAAYLPPDRKASRQQGVYMVTRGSDGDSLQRHHYAGIANTCVHEGYPGHHLQLASANLHPSRVRPFFDAVELIEGWAHYCEETMLEAGFEASDESRYAQAHDELFRAARILIDVNLHEKQWNFDVALRFLREQTDMDEDAARAEIRRYTQTPGYPLSYLVGKHLLFDLKKDLRRTFGGDLTDRRFHDLVIGEGSMPVFLAREAYPDLLRRELQARRA